MISREQSAALKGLLICLIVLGHNVFFSEVFHTGCWVWLYSFHVSCFFILPFFYPEREFSWQRVKKNARRLLWPYTYMFVSLFLVNYFIRKEATMDGGLVNTYLTGNQYRLKDYTGFQYLWFLPPMFSMLVFKDVYSLGKKFLNRILLAAGGLCFIIAWVFFFIAPYSISVNVTLAQYSLLSCMLGLGMFFLGHVTSRIVSKWNVSKWFCAGILAVSLLVTCISYGESATYYMVHWVSRAVCPIAAFCLLLNWHGYNLPLFRKLGELSLPIYLFHQPVNYVTGTLLASWGLPPAVSLAVSFVFVLTVSYFLSKLLTLNRFTNKVLFAKS